MSNVNLFNSALKKQHIKTSPARTAIIKMYLVHAKSSGRAFPSTLTVAKETGLSRRTIFREKAWLVSVGALIEIGCVARAIPIYVPNMDVILNPKTYNKSEDQGMTQSNINLDTQSMTQCHTSVTQRMTPCHPYKQKYIKNRTTTEPVVVDAAPKKETQQPDHPKIQDLYTKLQNGSYNQESVAQLISAKLMKDVGQPIVEKVNTLASEAIHYIKKSDKTAQHAFHCVMKMINEGRWERPKTMGSDSLKTIEPKPGVVVNEKASRIQELRHWIDICIMTKDDRNLEIYQKQLNQLKLDQPSHNGIFAI